MKRRKLDSGRERRLLIGFITSRRFLAQAARVIDDVEIIESEPYRIVAKWCLDYYGEYKKAPGIHIEDLYHKWSDGNDNKDLVQAVGDFLGTLSEQYDRDGELNIPYLLDDLGDFINKRKIVQLKESLEYAIVAGNIPQAQEALATYRKVELGNGASADVERDKEGWKQAFSEPAEPIITFDGDAGRFFNAALTRDALVGIQAPEKTGKTFWCVEFAMRALRQRRKVALFEVGDLSKSQIYKRLGVRWAKRPIWKSQTKHAIKMPSSVEIDESEDTGYSLEYDEVRPRDVVTLHSVKEGIEQCRRASGWTKRGTYLKMSVHPTKTINVAGISSVLDRWEQESDFQADVCIIDYADILAPESSLKHKDHRHDVEETWAALRRLSQERHALVIVPTQANAATYGNGGGRLQNMGNFSEDKRKYAHVTAMMGLNQTPEEKDMQGMRINWLVLREAAFNISAPLYVGTCFALGRALCCAKFPDRLVTSHDNNE